MAERTTREEPGAGLLIVEDDPRIAAVLAKGLGKQGFESESVTTGSEAIARIEAGGIDLLLLDLGLPDLDGLEVLRVLRERGVAVPVIVITSRTDPRDRATALELGVREYLTKPFAWADVWAAVRRCVTAREQA
jgi:two-component system response regulator QseB